jgi:murein DD-endopeptidase MepM/ murein hydrolase activator NlpD
VRALPRSGRSLLPLALFVVCTAAVAASVYSGRRASELQSDVASMRIDLGRLQKLNDRSTLDVTILERQLEAVSHPLHAALVWPVSGAVTSPFGPRGCCSVHPGIDIDAPEGADVRAAAAGTVEAAGWESGYGNRVVVDHGRGLETVYAHLGSIDVHPSEAVTSATVVGAVGCTGSCDGVHLHFEIRLHGKTSDPAFWLPSQPRAVAALQWGG